MLAREIFFQPIVGSARVGFHTLETRNARGDLRDVAISFASHPLPGDGLEKFMHRQAAGIARSALGGKNMIRPGGLVAEGNGRLLAKEERAVAGESGQPPVEIEGMNFEMLGCVAVGYLRELCARIAQMIEKQPNGAKGDLLENNSDWNIFYVTYVSGYVVSVHWDSGHGEWHVNAWRVGGFDWKAGYRVFSRA